MCAKGGRRGPNANTFERIHDLYDDEQADRQCQTEVILLEIVYTHYICMYAKGKVHAAACSLVCASGMDVTASTARSM